jgi:transposase
MNEPCGIIGAYYSGALYEFVEKRIAAMLPLLNERQRRLYLACEARTLGSGGIAEVSRISGVSPDTVAKGIRELAAGAAAAETGRSRKIPKGRKSIQRRYPDILDRVQRIIGGGRGEAEHILHYTGRSAGGISAALKKEGLNVSTSVVARILKEDGYKLRKSKKREGMGAGPAAEARFVYIDRKVRSYLERGEPVLAIEAGEFDRGGEDSAGAEYDHDYLAGELGKPVPSACYDLFRRIGFVNAGLDSRTAGLAVECLERWWEAECFEPYRGSGRMLITADFCGGNGWAAKLQGLADRINKKITVLHFPSGITKWDKIEHRFYSFISRDISKDAGGVQGKPLVRAAVIINLIGAGRDTGLTVECAADAGPDPRGTPESGARAGGGNAGGSAFRGEWNYTVIPAAERASRAGWEEPPEKPGFRAERTREAGRYKGPPRTEGLGRRLVFAD